MQDIDGMVGRERGGWRWQLQSFVDETVDERHRMGESGSALWPITAAVCMIYLKEAVCKCVPFSMIKPGVVGEWESEGRWSITKPG